MFGLTFEKLLLLAVIAALVLGPDRLPAAAQKLGELARGLRAFADGARGRVRDEMGPEFDEVDWSRLDPRKYDPRRIVREALRESIDPPPAPRPATPKVRGSIADAARPPVSRPGPGRPGQDPPS